MAQTIADHNYVSILNGVVNSVFLGSELPEYNENDIKVIDVTDVNPKPEINWSYDESSNTFTDPAQPLTLDEARENKYLAISQSQAAHLLPMQINYLGHEFDLTQETYVNVSGAAAFIALTGIISPDFAWIDYNNNSVPMNLDEFKGFVALIANVFQYAYSHAAELKAQVATATTIEQVNAIPNW